MKYSGAMKAFLASVSLFFAALGFSAPCRADIIYSNLGPGDMEIGGPGVVGTAAAPYFGLAPSGQSVPFLFPSGGNFSADSFTLGMDYYLPGLPLSPLFDADLYTNIQTEGYNPTGPSSIINQIGTEIAEIGQALQAPSSPGLVTLSPPTPISLTSGSLYWILLTPNNPLTSVIWDDNSVEVDGTLLTPEPATFGLLTCALATLTAIQRKRRPR